MLSTLLGLLCVALNLTGIVISKTFCNNIDYPIDFDLNDYSGVCLFVSRVYFRAFLTCRIIG